MCLRDIYAGSLTSVLVFVVVGTVLHYPAELTVLLSIFSCHFAWFTTQLYVGRTADSVLISEVSFIQAVLYREIPLQQLL